MTAVCFLLQISMRGEIFCAIVSGLSLQGVLSAPAVFGCLRRALCTPLTSLAMASLHAASFACGAIPDGIRISKLQISLQEVYVASGMSLTSILPQVSA